MIFAWACLFNLWHTLERCPVLHSCNNCLWRSLYSCCILAWRIPPNVFSFCSYHCFHHIHLWLWHKTSISLAQHYVIFFNSRSANELFNIHLITLVFKIILNVLLHGWKFLDDCNHLKRFTWRHILDVNVMKKNLQLLYLIDNHLVIFYLVI